MNDKIHYKKKIHTGHYNLNSILKKTKQKNCITFVTDELRDRKTRHQTQPTVHPHHQTAEEEIGSSSHPPGLGVRAAVTRAGLDTCIYRGGSPPLHRPALVPWSALAARWQLIPVLLSPLFARHIPSSHTGRGSKEGRVSKGNDECMFLNTEWPPGVFKQLVL